ncbi:hypothetical protein JAO29_20400 [Edaphobacter sp. HDX4]
MTRSAHPGHEAHLNGGYGEVVIAEARALASIPNNLSSLEATPLLCAA